MRKLELHVQFIIILMLDSNKISIIYQIKIISIISSLINPLKIINKKLILTIIIQMSIINSQILDLFSHKKNNHQSYTIKNNKF